VVTLPSGLPGRNTYPAVEAALFRGKVGVIYGARQVGRTTLVQEILRRYADRGLHLNCDEPDIRDALTNRTSTELRTLMGRRNLVVIDEAQRVRDIGLALKLLAYTYPDLQMKVCFYDLGIRNALINNFNPLDLRNDSGPLWENYFVSERIKYNHNRRRHVNAYFWRTYDRAELDYLEEKGERLVGFECKWTATRWRPPAAFTAAYAESETHLVNRANYLDFLTA
jgi:predicted AAA+ superfamily ATPase